MGQTHYEKIEEVSTLLGQKNLISQKQLYAFRKDLSEGLGLAEIERFMENPSMENFLHEVIKKRYQAEHIEYNGFQPRNFKDPNRLILASKARAVLNETIKNQVHQITCNWKAFSLKMCSLFIDVQKQSKIETTLWKIVGEVLDVSWMEISETVTKVDDRIREPNGTLRQAQPSRVLHEAQGSMPSHWKSKNYQFNMAPLIVNCRENKRSDLLLRWRIEGKLHEKGFEADFFSNNVELAQYLNDIGQEKNKKFQFFVQEFMKIYQHIQNSVISAKQKKLEFFCKIFSLHTIFLALLLQFMMQKICKQVSNIAQIMCLKARKDFLIKDVSEELGGELKKYISQQIEKMREYTGRIYKKNGNYLFFDQYGILEFLYLPDQQRDVLTKFQSYRNPTTINQIKIYTLFSHNKKLRHQLSAVSKGLLDKRIQLESADGKFIFQPSELGQISHIILEIPAKLNQKLLNHQNSLPISLNPSPKKSKNISSNGFPKSFFAELQQLSTNLPKQKSDIAEEKFNYLDKDSSPDLLEKTLMIFSKDMFFRRLTPASKDKFRKFISEIIIKTEESKKNIFSFTHTLNSLVWIQELTSSDTSALFQDLDKFCLLLTPLAINLFPQFSLNTLEFYKNTTISEFFNHQRTIQNQCARIFFKILRRGSCNFLFQMGQDEFRTIRRCLIENIFSSNEEPGSQSFQFNKPKHTQQEKIKKNRWKNFILKCSKYSIFINNEVEATKWIQNLNQYCLNLQTMINKENINNVGNLNNYANKQNYLKEIALPIFKQFYAQLFNETVKDEKLTKMFQKIGKSIEILQNLCGVEKKKVIYNNKKIAYKQNAKKDVKNGSKKIR